MGWLRLSDCMFRTGTVNFQQHSREWIAWVDFEIDLELTMEMLSNFEILTLFKFVSLFF
jgi:hypothetical protein